MPTNSPTKDGFQLYTEQDMSAPEATELEAGRAAVFSRRCPGKETPNEDAVAVIRSGARPAVLAVADGMGGGHVGERASAIALCSLAQTIVRSAAEGVLLRTGILNGIEAANQAIKALGVGAATTFAAVEIGENTVRPYHIGDSMILLTGLRGRIKLQTVSHSPVGFAVESGQLDEAEAMHHEDRHLVSNVLGQDDMRIEVGPIVPLARYDTLLLASDGLFDNLRVSETVELIRKGPIRRAARRLAAQAHIRMTEPAPSQPCKPDDVSFILFRRAR